MTDKLNLYGAIAISVIAMVLFAGAMIASFVLHNETMESLTVGAAVTMAGAAVSFWIGSSSGSQKKDAIIAAASAKPPTGT